MGRVAVGGRCVGVVGLAGERERQMLMVPRG